MEYSNLFVVLMGLGTVFFGLICLVLLTMLMGAICRSTGAKEAPKTAAPAPAPAAVPAGSRQAMIAAMAAAIAEDMGTEPSGIRILSVKQI